MHMATHWLPLEILSPPGREHVELKLEVHEARDVDQLVII